MTSSSRRTLATTKKVEVFLNEDEIVLLEEDGENVVQKGATGTVITVHVRLDHQPRILIEVISPPTPILTGVTYLNQWITFTISLIL